VARERILDPTLVLELVDRLGSYGRAAQYLADEGVTNPYTGKPFARASLWQAARKSPQFAKDTRKRKKHLLDAQGRVSAAMRRRIKRASGTKKGTRKKRGG
jgi:hypothetical protein